MANYTASARSNYVKVSDIDRLRHSLAPWPISIHEARNHETDEEGNGYFCFLCDNESGWPAIRWEELTDTTSEEFEFDWETDVMPFIAPNEVLVIMEVGNVKLQYLSGYATAYIRRETEIDFTVESVAIRLYDIYEKAKNAFGVEHVTVAEY